MSDTKSTFETLEVWIISREMRNKISALSKCLPPDEKYKLTDQMIRASRSVTAIIVSGFGFNVGNTKHKIKWQQLKNLKI